MTTQTISETAPEQLTSRELVDYVKPLVAGHVVDVVVSESSFGCERWKVCATLFCGTRLVTTIEFGKTREEAVGEFLRKAPVTFLIEKIASPELALRTAKGTKVPA